MYSTNAPGGERYPDMFHMDDLAAASVAEPKYMEASFLLDGVIQGSDKKVLLCFRGLPGTASEQYARLCWQHIMQVSAVWRLYYL